MESFVHLALDYFCDALDLRLPGRVDDAQEFQPFISSVFKVLNRTRRYVHGVVGSDFINFLIYVHLAFSSEDVVHFWMIEDMRLGFLSWCETRPGKAIADVDFVFVWMQNLPQERTITRDKRCAIS